MGQDDPFGSDSEKTVIRPNPGGRRGLGPVPPPEPSSQQSSSGASYAAAPPKVLIEAGLNPLVSAAAPLLILAARLRATTEHRNIEALRDRIVAEIREFERRVSGAEQPADVLRGAHYALCATIDDVITNTPWGGSGAWARYSMASSFHNDVAGGDRFFEFLAHFQKDPGRYGDILELMYLCLSLGFEGRLRVVDRGASEWGRIREGLSTLLRQRRGGVERDLSPHWRGLEEPHRPLTSVLPAWVVGAVAVALLAVMFVGFSFAVSGASDDVYARFSNLPPGTQVALRVDAPMQAPADDGVLKRLRTFLAPEIKEGLVDVSQKGRAVTVRLRGSEMFASGTAALNQKYLDVVRRVAAALDEEPGAVQVLGYTDNVPIRSVRFPSNFELSVARATAVQELVKSSLKKPRDLAIEGRADADPIAANTTPEGRAANRRIDIVLATRDDAR